MVRFSRLRLAVKRMSECRWAMKFKALRRHLAKQSCQVYSGSQLPLCWVGRLKRCAFTCALVIFFGLIIWPSAQAAQVGIPGIADIPLDIVLLVDESGSLSYADVAQEIQAASTIAQTPLNPLSQVTVIGFGGADGVTSDQDPTTVICQPTLTDSAASLEYLDQCVHGLHRRTKAEGNDTDYAAALAKAMSYLTANAPIGSRPPAGATKAIFMMTDSGLNVSHDPAYSAGGIPAARRAVDLQLAAARRASVQIWPLGFGAISSGDRSYLDYLAAGGAQMACSTNPAATPRAIVTSSPDIASTIFSLYSDAACLGISSGGSTLLEGGQTRTLTVNIPATASDAAISVDKGNPAFRVVYLTPAGMTVTGGSLSGSRFQRSGQDSGVDVLHIEHVQSGVWKIRVTAPGGLSSQPVSATAFWQGVVRPQITASPSNARPGQQIHVTISALGPNGPIIDPITLNGLGIQLDVTGDGLPGRLNVPVSNLGEPQGTPQDGTYQGTFTAPARTGVLTVTGSISGHGLHASQASIQIPVGGQAALLQGTLAFNAPSSVAAGQSIQGQIAFSNQTGKARQVELTLTAAPAVATLRAPQGTVKVPPGTSEISFTITLDGASLRGPSFIEVEVIDPSNPNVVYIDRQLLIVVVSPHNPIWPYLLILGLLILLVIALTYRWRYRVFSAVAPTRIFISYRRDDTDFLARWLYGQLAKRFGKNRVFKDIESIMPGEDFTIVINDKVRSCDALLALIGDRWLTIADRTGRRRLEDPQDYVRLEIEAALARNILVVPILTARTPMPRADQLPGSLAGLTHRNPLEFSQGHDAVDFRMLQKALMKTGRFRQWLRRLRDVQIS
jgi:TIR domain/von Willebrand factor type A domain